MCALPNEGADIHCEEIHPSSQVEVKLASYVSKYDTWLSDNCIPNAKLTEFTKSNKQEITMMHIAITFRPKYLGAAVWTSLTGRGKVKPRGGGDGNGGLQATGLTAWQAVVRSVSRWGVWPVLAAAVDEEVLDLRWTPIRKIYIIISGSVHHESHSVIRGCSNIMFSDYLHMGLLVLMLQLKPRNFNLPCTANYGAKS